MMKSLDVAHAGCRKKLSKPDLYCLSDKGCLEERADPVMLATLKNASFRDLSVAMMVFVAMNRCAGLITGRQWEAEENPERAEK